MIYLIDTNIVSELRKKQRCDENVAAWQASVPLAQMFISVVSLMEIRSGVLTARRKDPVFADLLHEWYEGQIKPAFLGRMIPVDLEVSERCALLLAQRSRGVADSLIAATALVHNLILVTRNVADFTDTGVEIVNPWEVGAR